MKKIEAYELPTQEEKDLQKSEYAKKFEKINEVVTSEGWQYVKEIFRKYATDEELKKLLAENNITDFEKVGQLVWLENRAIKKIEKAIKELEKFNVA